MDTICLEVRNVTMPQVREFSSILQEAALWLRSMGHPMWTLKQVSAKQLLKDYELGQMYLGYVERAPAATLILQERDGTFWPDAEGDDSLFLHKLSVRRAHAKLGVAQAMIEFAKEECRRRGRVYLRLDCASDRPRLCEFYEAQGFKRVREAVMFKRYPTAFYQYDSLN